MKGHFSAVRLRRFARNGEGATIIEFALIFPFVLLITFGIMEISLYMVSMVTLEGGLKEASRYGITAQTGTHPDPTLVPTAFKVGNDPRLENIGLILNRHTLDLINLNNATVTINVYRSFSAIKDGEPYTDLPNIPTNGTPPNGHYDGPGTQGTPGLAGEPYSDMNCDGSWTPAGASSTGPGAAGNIVVYRIAYDWQVLTPIIGKFIGTSNGSGGYKIPMAATMVVKNEPQLSGSTFCK